jgi:hypothetical protein
MCVCTYVCMCVRRMHVSKEIIQVQGPYYEAVELRRELSSTTLPRNLQSLTSGLSQNERMQQCKAKHWEKAINDRSCRVIVLPKLAVQWIRMQQCKPTMYHSV